MRRTARGNTHNFNVRLSVRREIEYLKKETAQRRAHEESEATHKEEADNLQEKVRKTSPVSVFLLNLFIFGYKVFLFLI